jgi:hypothetical protein
LGIDIAPRGDDHVLHPARDEEIPICAVAEIAAVDPSITPSDGVGRVRVAKVALHDGRTAEVNGAFFTVAKHVRS